MVRLGVAPIYAVRQWHADIEAESACRGGRQEITHYKRHPRGGYVFFDISIHQFLICSSSFVFIYVRPHLERGRGVGGVASCKSETVVQTWKMVFSTSGFSFN